MNDDGENLDEEAAEAAEGVGETDTPEPDPAPTHEESAADEVVSVENPPPPDPRIAELEAERDRAAQRAADLEAAEAEARSLVADRDASIASLTAERDEARASAAQATERHDELYSAWVTAAKKTAIQHRLQHYAFVGSSSHKRDAVCNDFVNMVLPGVNADLNRKTGLWTFTGPKGESIDKYFLDYVDRYDYMFAADDDRGSVSRGGKVPGGGNVPPPYPPVPAKPGSIRAIAERYQAKKKGG